MSVLHLWHLVAAPLSAPDPREIEEEGQTEIVRLCRVGRHGVNDQATQDGCCLALCISPAFVAGSGVFLWS